MEVKMQKLRGGNVIFFLSTNNMQTRSKTRITRAPGYPALRDDQLQLVGPGFDVLLSCLMNTYYMNAMGRKAYPEDKLFNCYNHTFSFFDIHHHNTHQPIGAREKTELQRLCAFIVAQNSSANEKRYHIYTSFVTAYRVSPMRLEPKPAGFDPAVEFADMKNAAKTS